MHWIIQSNMYREEAFEQLLETLNRLGLPHSVHKVVPFTHALEPEICACLHAPGNPCVEGTTVSAQNPIIAMGTYTMTEIARARGWKPGSYLNDNFDYREQLRWWGDRMLNANASFGKLKDLSPNFLEDSFFIRPIGDSKHFAGTVMSWARFEPWRAGVLALKPEDGATMSGETEVMVCTPKEIHREHRLWIVDREVVTQSVYKTGSRVHYNHVVDERVIEFGRETAMIWSPAKAYVMDVAETPEGLKVIEVNNINSAGWYAADMNKLVLALEEINPGDSGP